MPTQGLLLGNTQEKILIAAKRRHKVAKLYKDKFQVLGMKFQPSDDVQLPLGRMT